MAVKKATAHRPAQAHMEYVTTRDGRRVKNTAWNGIKKQGTTPSQPPPAAQPSPPAQQKGPERRLAYHLVAVNANANSNKEYLIFTEPDGSVTAEYGRIRDGASKRQKRSYPAGQEDYLLAKKLKRGYTAAEKVDDVHGGGTANLDGLNPDRDPEIQRVIEHFAAKNKHAIETASGGSIKVDDDGIARTAVGVISRSGIDKARGILAGGALTDNDVEQYLRLIPQQTKTVHGFGELLRKDPAFNQRQEDLLRQLEAGLDVYEQRKAAATDGAVPPPSFRHTMRKPSKDEDARMRALFNDNIRVGHPNTPTRPKIKSIFAIDDHHTSTVDSLRAKGEKSRLSFHGTAPSNCLSLTTGGLKGPADLAKSGTKPRYTGSMFSNLERNGKGGTGVYLAQTKTAGDGSKFGNWGGNPNAASKSMGYTSDGSWMSKSSGNKYMYVVEAFTGNECRSTPTDSRSSVVSRFRQDKSYDSIVIKGGEANVRNDEMVVPSERCRIVAVIEIE